MFENLQQRKGLAFKRNDQAAVANICGAGLFVWSPVVKAKLEGASFHGTTTLQQRQLIMAVYAMELLFDLCLDPHNNASASSGYETAQGQF